MIKPCSVFLSTPSARRATRFRFRSHRGYQHFYPRPPRGGRRLAGAVVALCAGHFYPRPPRGGRRRHSGRAPLEPEISIHALREEGDEVAQTVLPIISISIHALREEGDLQIQRPNGRNGVISIHALREEGDVRTYQRRRGRIYFYPRPPRGGRRAAVRVLALHSQFLSTPSARRATNRRCIVDTSGKYFYPRPPRGGRQQKQRQNLYFQTNYTTFCTNLEEP